MLSNTQLTCAVILILLIVLIAQLRCDKEHLEGLVASRDVTEADLAASLRK